MHDHPEPLEAETDHQLKISHEHATSHQSFKLHHYHAVPVYIKDHHLLKSPIEVGGLKHIHKVRMNIHGIEYGELGGRSGTYRI